MKALVLGGAGFIGSHLVDSLRRDRHTVVAYDNLYTGQERNLPREAIFVEGDVTAPDTSVWFKHYDPVAPYDVIYNLACPASPVHYQRDPVFTTRTCLLGTMLALDLARHWGARVVQASTSEVYGDPTVSPQHEGYRGNVNCWGPRACYDEGKRAAESLCYDYKTQYNVDVRVARIFNTYGPRMRADDGRVVSNFLCQLIRGEPVTLNGGGRQTRSFCYVSDTVRALRLLAAREQPLAHPINVGNPHEITMMQLAAYCAYALGIDPYSSEMLKPEQTPMPQDDPERRCPDITHIRTLGWSPEVPIDTGLKLTAEYFRGVVHPSLDPKEKS